MPFDDGPFEWFTKYYGAYVQDDWRVSRTLTLNYGLRLEHEDGLRRSRTARRSPSIRTSINPLDALVPKTGLLAGRTLKGGLIFAGVDGAPEAQGNPAAIKVAPRVGVDLRAQQEHGPARRLRPVLRAVELHQGAARPDRLHADDAADSVRRHDRACRSRRSTIRSRAACMQPIGSSLGLLTGTGGTINFVDQNKGDPKVHQYSVDVQRELPGAMAVTIGYIGATGRDIGYCGTVGNAGAAININQIDPAVARAAFPRAERHWNAAALRAVGAQPVLRRRRRGRVRRRRRPFRRGQLLRPFPQFGDVFMYETTDGGRRQYHAATFVLDKRDDRAGGAAASATP